MILNARTQFDDPLIPDIPYSDEVPGFIEHAVETPDVLFAKLEKGYDVGVHLPEEQESEDIYYDFFSLADRLQMEAEYDRIRRDRSVSKSVEKNSVPATQTAGEQPGSAEQKGSGGLGSEKSSTIVKDE